MVAVIARRREMFWAAFVYICLHNQAPGYVNNFFRTKADTGNNRTRRCNKIYLPHVGTEYEILFQGGIYACNGTA